MPRVSVVIPTYNRAGQIARAITSVCRQSYTDFEVIVVDDGSTDDTCQIVGDLATADKRIRYLAQENRGRSAARNTGISAAQSDYIAFLDSDDEFLPDKLEAQIEAFEQHPELGLVYHQVVMVDDTGHSLFGGAPLPGRLSGWIYPDLLFIKNTIIATPSVMVRQQALSLVGVFDQTMHVCEDLDLWRRVARHYPVLQLEQPLAVICYRRNEPLALPEKIGARLSYYRKALADDPSLRHTIWSKLMGEMYWAYGTLAVFYGDRRTGLPLIARSAWYTPMEFGRLVLTTGSKRLALLTAGSTAAIQRAWRLVVGSGRRALLAAWRRLSLIVTAGSRATHRWVRAQTARFNAQGDTMPAQASNYLHVAKLVGTRIQRAAKRFSRRQLRRKLFDITIGLAVRTFPLQVGDRLAKMVSDRLDDPIQAAFAQHGYRIAKFSALSDDLPPGPVSTQVLEESYVDESPVPTVAATGHDDLMTTVDRVAAELAQQSGNPAYEAFYRNGFYLLRKHFYLPIPDEAELDYGFAIRPSALVGLDMNDEAMLQWLEQVCSMYVEEFRTLFPMDPASDPRQFYLINGNYMAIDAQVYYTMIRHYKPKRIVEIGAGFSTLLAAAACEHNHQVDGQLPHLMAVEPYPLEVLKSGIPYLSCLVESKVQDVDMTVFTELEAGDILFIDSSHALRAGGDVHLEYLEILPRLAPGVLVHLHDISLPKPYPRTYFQNQLFWNEQYLLQAFLAFNQRFEVIWPGNYMMERYPSRVRAVFPEFDVMRLHFPQSEPSAFWMRVRTVAGRS